MGADVDDVVEENLRRLLAGNSALILEDESEFHEPIVATLRRFGFARTDVCTTVEAALQALAARRYDVALLDRVVPDGDGLSVLRSLRQHEDPVIARTPALFITQLSDEAHRVNGLLAGADDYVPKPANDIELVARIAVQLRRRSAGSAGETTPPSPDGALVNGPLRLSVTSRTVTLFGDPVTIARQGFDMLAVLMRHPGEPMTPLMLFERCWPQWHFLPDGWEKNVYQAVRRVRFAFAETEKTLPTRLTPVIVNLRGQGYMLRDLAEAA